VKQHDHSKILAGGEAGDMVFYKMIPCILSLQIKLQLKASNC
jgi:hypothetical protein